jgi:hypothetical protein
MANQRTRSTNQRSSEPPDGRKSDHRGGRVLYITDGQPIWQIASHDRAGRLIAFCIKRNPTRVADTELERTQFSGQLQIFHLAGACASVFRRWIRGLRQIEAGSDLA